MANEEKLDFTQEPIIIELGYSVLPIVTIAENKKYFYHQKSGFPLAKKNELLRYSSRYS